MATLKRWNGSSWVTVPDGTAFKYWNGSAWVNPNAVKYWNGSSWVTCWNKSDPQTLTVTADFTSNIRVTSWDAAGESSNNAQANPRIGRFNGSQPYHYIGILGFPMSSISSAMGTRPTITGGRVYIYRLSGSGLSTATGTLRIGTWTQSNFRNTPSVSSIGSYTDFSPLRSHNVGNWTDPSGQWFDLDPQHVQDLVNGRGLTISEVTTGWTSSGGTTSLYSKIAGIQNGSNLPRLEVTIDY